jgi:ribonuclease P protein component
MDVTRLKTRPQFQAVLSAKILAKTPHFALHHLPLRSSSGEGVHGIDACLFGNQHAWAGAMSPKRWAKRAVTRNTIKRQIYHVSLLFEPQLAPGAHVVRLRSAFDTKLFPSAASVPLRAALRQELIGLFGQAGHAALPPSP